MKRNILLGLTALHLTLAAPAAAMSEQAQQPASAARIGAGVDIPYEQFTLPNGLRLLVHTDRKAPVVAVSVWYDIGSKHEPEGKTGFAHLFEHLMFNGSENADDDFFAPLKDMGATRYNGTTWFDRTNYYETVPTGALEKILWLESDRMGHLLGAITQEKLDTQRGVVQNEKRQGDNRPYGLVQYHQSAALFPPGHPYGHPTIGSMADLDSASLADVHAWFRQHYGPNNAIISLAGDIDMTRAKALVGKYFGGIPRGPTTAEVSAPVPTLPARRDEIITDRVATTVLTRSWIVPGLGDPARVDLDIAASILGGLASSRLDTQLVRDEKLAVSTSATVTPFTQISQFEISVNVRPEADPDQVSERLDAIVADFVRSGPTADEVDRAATQNAADTLKSLESAGGKASALAEGLLYTGDPTFYRKDLAAYAAATPKSVRAAMARWLSRPVYALRVDPGARLPYAEAGAAAATPPATGRDASPVAKKIQREASPALGPVAELAFPDVTHMRLSNGIEIVYAQRTAVPTTYVTLSLDAGYAADPKQKLGTAALTTMLLTEGTGELGPLDIARRQERLGAKIGAGSSMDRSNVSLSALSANLLPSLDLFAGIALRPTFAADAVTLKREHMLAGIRSALTEPGAIASRILQPALYGAVHPYSGLGGSGDPAIVARLTRDDLAAFHRAWFRPDKAKLFVVSDLPLATIAPELEKRFGSWIGTGPAGIKNFAAEVPVPVSRILLVDRKDSPQSLIVGGLVLEGRGTDDQLALESASDIVGGDFLSRINMDLRETKGWSYGVRAGFGTVVDRATYRINAPVQADKTGPAIAALIANYRSFLGVEGTTQAELERTQNGDIRQLPGAFETGGSVMAALQENDLLGRGDDHYERLPARIRQLSAASLDSAARSAIDPDKLLWVVVGDADIVRPQLDALGLPVEIAVPR